MKRPIEVPPYGARLWVAGTRREWREARETVRSLPKRPDGAGSTTLAVYTSGGRTRRHLVVWIDRRQSEGEADLVNTVAHEAVHAACTILDELEEQYDGGPEALAYLAGWIAEQVWARVRA